MTWFDENTGLFDLGWHEVEPKNGGVRRFERDDNHQFGYWELDRPLSDVAVAHNLAMSDAAITAYEDSVERSREAAKRRDLEDDIDRRYPLKRGWFG